jgi:hypothetical protein
MDVTSYVQKYAPSYDLPYAFVSLNDDNYNRNVILSRFPFQDLNGDGESTLSDIDWIFADLYAPGGDGGIRGYMFAEIDLPAITYGSDLVIGNGHLKSGSSSSDKLQRLEASQNIAYWIDYLLNGAGSGIPDPRGMIRDIPAVTRILCPDVAVIWGGDLNEDELTNGRKGPAEWMANAQLTGGNDGTDRDRSDSTYDDARDVFTNDRETLGSSKLDYLIHQDSVASLRRSWIFDSTTLTLQAVPPELNGFSGGPLPASSIASDHLTVLSDYVLPGPRLSVGLTPINTSAAPGEKIFFDANVTNLTNELISGGTAWVDVCNPDGTPFFASNPKFGPKTFNLQPLASKNKYGVGIRVPLSQEPGTGFIVRAYVGTCTDEVSYTDEFVFDVVE